MRLKIRRLTLERLSWRQGLPRCRKLGSPTGPAATAAWLSHGRRACQEASEVESQGVCGYMRCEFFAFHVSDGPVDQSWNQLALGH